MTILGAALRAELGTALGLDALRKDLRAELRALAREVRAVRALLRGAASTNGGATGGAAIAPIAAVQIRAARQSLGDSRKAFAHRLGVSPGIVFAWESGRSTPRRKAIVARLRRLLATPPSALTRRGPQRSRESKAGSERKRVLTLSPKRRAMLKLQGQYMGYLRSLGAPQKAEVKKVKAASGLPAAIKLAKMLRRG